MDEPTTTRRALHGVAELLMAGPQHRESGTIRLAVTPGGFATAAGPRLRVAGTELVAGDRAIPMNGTTFRELAAAAGITDPGAPAGLYRDGSGAGLDDPIGIDAGAAGAVHTGFARGDEALRRFAPEVAPVLWPEHFDVGIAAGEVNYGVSAGDSYLDEPYAYAAPWKPRAGSFWNAPFGAARPLGELPGATAILDFFMEGRDRAASDPVRED
ncbi:hypothetical protein [Spirillospora sp. NPDC029432]|uniref:hypothetical protein n=1 Tax=Spirillospora sp. NPDC029432 TaxID=3154599 RepID=UPI00345145CF